MLEQYLCMSRIAEARSHSCTPLEVEMHCFGRAFTENVTGLSQGSKARGLPVKPGLCGCQVFCSFSESGGTIQPLRPAVLSCPCVLSSQCCEGVCRLQLRLLSTQLLLPFAGEWRVPWAGSLQWRVRSTSACDGRGGDSVHWNCRGDEHQGAANPGTCNLEGSPGDANTGSAADSQQPDRKRLPSAVSGFLQPAVREDFGAVSLLLWHSYHTGQRDSSKGTRRLVTNIRAINC